MEEIISILMRRDHLTRIEAYDLIEECREEILNACAEDRYWEAEDILQDYLGLEPDYLMYLI